MCLCVFFFHRLLRIILINQSIMAKIKQNNYSSKYLFFFNNYITVIVIIL